MKNGIKTTFKTTLQCGGCVARVKPLLDRAAFVEDWAVDTTHPDKLLTVHTADVRDTEIISLIKNLGFEITKR